MLGLTIGATGRAAEAPRKVTNVDSLPMFVDADTLVYAYGANSGPDTDLYRARLGEFDSERAPGRATWPATRRGAVRRMR